jgi:hypothetical protein
MQYNIRLSSLLVLLLFSFVSRGQHLAKSVAIAFYNSENFFDTVDDPEKNDEEFTPTGKYRYTMKVYANKLRNIAQVIQGMSQGDNLAMVGMAEVENKTVLNDLIHQPAISGHNYRYIWYSGGDPRGINVALVYDPRLLTVLSSESLPVDISGTGGKTETRDILHVYGLLLGDTVHIFVNHWPSRRGGMGESDAKRTIAAAVAKKTIGDIQRKKPSARVIVMGDFNDNPADASLASVLGAACNRSSVPPAGLYNPYCELFNAGMGTEVYKHQWNLFDQVIISGSFLTNQRNKLHFERADVYKPDFLIDHYKGHEGEPHRSFVGTKWINGYSDHFPVLLYLSK